MKAIASFTVVLLFVLGGCELAHEPMQARPAPPPGVAPYSGTASTTAAQLAMNDVRTRLSRHYQGQWEIARYDLNEDASWSAVRAHYASALGADWNADARFPEQATGYRCAVWSDGSRAIAIAVQSPSPPDRHPVLTVFLPEAANQ